MMTCAAFNCRRFGLVLMLSAGALSTVARAAEVAVRASVTRGITPMGEPLQYQIKITGARRVGEPPEVRSDGLNIRYAGPSETSVMRLQNGSFFSERTIILVYQVVPEKSGTFTIPAVAVEADGKTYRTEPVGLTVHPSGSPEAPGDPQSVGFAEFVVPKKTAYLGETIPVELRLYVDARVRWQPTAMPEIEGEGFTKQKLPEPAREQTQRNGREYDVLIFKTAITPSRAGTITLGPSEIPYTARVPRARRNAPRSFFDDDVFGDPFYSSTQQLKAKVEPVAIAVKPLPAAGKPREFSGAVGRFEFTAEGRPKQVNIGDPVAMTLRVRGGGNFDRMNAPTLADPTGWRTYPPSSTFQATDTINYAGTKTFEFAVVPETRKTEMPVFRFSYFDPVAEKYVTLNSKTAALVVTSGGVSAEPPKNSSRKPDAPPVPARRPDPEDILGLRYDLDAGRSFAPLHRQRQFWYAQGALGLGLLGFLGWKMRRIPDAAAQVAAELRREKTAALARLRVGEMERATFLETAARVAQIETALAAGRPAAGIDAAAVQASAKLSAASASVIDEIFAQRAVLLYAGGGDVEGPIATSMRKSVLDALEELERSHGRG